MNKITNIVCLILWSIVLGVGILDVATGGTVNPVTHIGACLICVIHYANELFWGDRD